ncbi:hypothetical protein PVAND_007691 [Polypedilum vanderplanki]|uniref:Adenosine deaminase n=1 Tax=Polypedilum vanderplanki TaxID=319348 RepID=A0A9J6C861_POLVA|nr:hypothetical protein PVAND_007691 [Polypedilum vanderplanki]
MSHFERQIFSLLLLFATFTSLAVARVTAAMGSINVESERPSFEKYTKLRQEYVNEHQARALGSDVLLSEDEKHFNSVLMDLKADELARGFDNPFNFTPARHFFTAMKSIETSPLFKLIQKMPKGAILHAHDDAICSTDYVVSLTKWENLWQWGNLEGDDLPKFLFSRQKPEKIDNVEWRLVSDIRKEMGDDLYESKVRRFFTLIVDDPTRQYADINQAWNKFMDMFGVVGPIVTYTEAWRDYYRQTLQELYDDNVQYLEFRGLLPELYDLDGKKYGPIECAQIYVDVLKDFKQSHPDFVGSKFIFAPLRGVDDEIFDSYLPILQKLMNRFPEFIAGFDLVGQEDKGRPLIEYAERFLKYPSDIKFFFHAGETNWMGTTSDENLVKKNSFCIFYKIRAILNTFSSILLSCILIEYC